MRPQIQTRMMMLEVNVTERLLDRMRNAAAVEGMTQDGYIERAILNAIIESEKRASRHDRVFRDAEEYPYKCDYCAERFKLPMHRGNHVRAAHPEQLDPEDKKVIKEESIVILDPDLRDELIAAATEQVADDPKFKLADGMAELMDTFEDRLAQFADDVPRLD